MSKSPKKRLPWIVWLFLLAAGVLFWLWRRQQASELMPATGSPPVTMGAAPQNGSSASSGGASPAAAGPRRVVTRVHRGAPPDPPRPADRSEPAAPALAAEAADVAPPELSPVVELVSAEVVAEAEGVTPPADLDVPEIVAAEAPETAAAAEAAPEAAATVADDEPAVDAQPVNINTATLDDLVALPGIGPTLARRIIDYRETNGPFVSTEGLLAVQGIGSSNLTDFAHLVTV